MRKNIVIVLILLILASFVSFGASVHGCVTGISNNVSVGLPNYGWAMKNSEGQITGFQGINFLLGFSAKFFFSPLKADKWTGFWGWGTAFMVFPVYIQFGADYVSSNDFYVGFSLVDLIPQVEFGRMF